MGELDGWIRAVGVSCMEACIDNFGQRCVAIAVVLVYFGGTFTLII